MTHLEVLKDLASKGIVTHTGTYHADDVMSGALLLLAGVCDAQDINRVQNLPENFEGLAFDIGRGTFDHHQIDARVRDNGVKYAAFGLLWDFIGRDTIMKVYNEQNQKPAPSEVVEIAFEDFDAFIQMLDQTDNFGPEKYPNSLSYMISARSTVDPGDDGYYCAITMYLYDLECMVRRVIINAENKVLAKHMGTKEVVIIDNGKYIPAICFKGTKTKFLVQKSNREGLWNLNAVNPWSIVLEKDEMEGCQFLHTAKFLATFTSLEAASKAAFDNASKIPV